MFAMRLSMLRTPFRRPEGAEHSDGAALPGSFADLFQASERLGTELESDSPVQFAAVDEDWVRQYGHGNSVPESGAM